MDVRDRIVAACDAGLESRLAIRLSGVTHRRRGYAGCCNVAVNQATRPPLTGRCGRKPFCVGPLRQRLETLLTAQPDVTLAGLRDRTGVPCLLAAIGKTLHRLG